MYHLTLRTRNDKVAGPGARVMASTTSAATCPPGCGVRNSCYAKGGKLSMHWRKVTDGQRGGSIEALAARLAAAAPGTLFRHNQAGDLPGAGDLILVRDLRLLTDAAAHLRGWTYTHKPVLGNSLVAACNRAAIESANQRHTGTGLLINLSADSLADADRKLALGIAPVTVVIGKGAPRKLTTPGGATVRKCPAQLTEDNPPDKRVHCSSCDWCRVKRSFVVGFEAHGFGWKRLDSQIGGARG